MEIGTEVLEFPDDPSEVTLNAFLEFDAVQKEFEEWLKDQQTVDMEYQLEYVRFLMRMIYAFTESDLIEQVEVGNFNDHVLRVSGAPKLVQVDLAETGTNLFALYEKIFHALYSFKPKPLHVGDLEFQWKGKDFVIKGLYKDALTGTLKFKGLPTGQAVEALQVIKAYNSQDKDPDNSKRFSYLLQLLSIVALEKDEKFPTEDEKIIEWVNSRIEFFLDVTMDIALMVEDFFFGTMRALRAIQGLNTFLNHHHQAARQNKKRKRKKRIRASSKG